MAVDDQPIFERRGLHLGQGVQPVSTSTMPPKPDRLLGLHAATVKFGQAVWRGADIEAGSGGRILRAKNIALRRCGALISQERFFE